jgi:hypothetical protein
MNLWSSAPTPPRQNQKSVETTAELSMFRGFSCKEGREIFISKQTNKQTNKQHIPTMAVKNLTAQKKVCQQQ